MKNPIPGATLGATLGIGWTPRFQPKFSERFFQDWGGSRAPDQNFPFFPKDHEKAQIILGSNLFTCKQQARYTLAANDFLDGGNRAFVSWVLVKTNSEVFTLIRRGKVP